MKSDIIREMAASDFIELPANGMEKIRLITFSVLIVYMPFTFLFSPFIFGVLGFIFVQNQLEFTTSSRVNIVARGQEKRENVCTQKALR